METRQELVSIPEAAKRLNLTHDGVRKWLKRGVLAAKKVDNRWLVVLDNVERPRHDNGSRQPRQANTNVGHRERLITKFEEEVSFLRTQLSEQIATKDQQIAEKDWQINKLHGELDRLTTDIDA